MKSIYLSCILMSIFLLSGCYKTQIKDYMEPGEKLIVVNASIYTLNEQKPNATSLVASKGKIIYVGGTSGALKFKNSKSKVYDLSGKTVIPGLVDAHAHITSLGDFLENLDLTKAVNFLEVLSHVDHKARKLDKGKWIFGRGWDQNNWRIKKFPDNNQLSELTPDNPVFLKRVAGHAALVNKLALNLAGVDRNTKNPEGGKIIRNKNGEATGLLIDNAIELIDKIIPKKRVEDIKEDILKAQDSCLKVGLTQVHDAGIDETMFKAYETLAKEDKLKIRIYAMVDAYKKDFLNERLSQEPLINAFKGKFNLRTVKMYADGALGSRGALLSEPYSDDKQNSGLALTSNEEMRSITEKSLRQGYQVAIHAIGDKANSNVMDIYFDAMKTVNSNDPRLRIEHVQILNPKDLQRMKDMNLIASMQPTHCTSDMNWADERLGPERIKWGYTWKNILNKGIHFASGSDFPVESNNPMLSIYAAVTRKDLEGNPEEGFYPEQKLTIKEAVESFTKGAAYASFEENIKGELKEGMLADFIVLSDDIFEIKHSNIPNIKVLMTVIEGEVAYNDIK